MKTFLFSFLATIAISAAGFAPTVTVTHSEFDNDKEKGRVVIDLDGFTPTAGEDLTVIYGVQNSTNGQEAITFRQITKFNGTPVDDGLDPNCMDGGGFQRVFAKKAKVKLNPDGTGTMRVKALNCNFDRSQLSDWTVIIGLQNSGNGEEAITFAPMGEFIDRQPLSSDIQKAKLNLKKGILRVRSELKGFATEGASPLGSNYQIAVQLIKNEGQPDEQNATATKMPHRLNGQELLSEIDHECPATPGAPSLTFENSALRTKGANDRVRTRIRVCDFSGGVDISAWKVRLTVTNTVNGETISEDHALTKLIEP